jgi:hypothetical protein
MASLQAGRLTLKFLGPARPVEPSGDRDNNVPSSIWFVLIRLAKERVTTRLHRSHPQRDATWEFSIGGCNTSTSWLMAEGVEIVHPCLSLDQIHVRSMAMSHSAANRPARSLCRTTRFRPPEFPAKPMSILSKFHPSPPFPPDTRV